MEKNIRKDEFYELEFEYMGQSKEFPINAAFDRIDHYEPLGFWLLKIIDQEHGMVQAVLTEHYARKLATLALLPIVEREFLYESEHDLYEQSVIQQFEDSFGDED